MLVAKDIAKKNPEALRYFIRLLGRKLQTDYMCRSISWVEKGRVPDLDPGAVWFSESLPLNKEGTQACDLKVEVNETRTLSLASDLILPWPWERSRVASSISCIGEGCCRGAWKQDPLNHQVEYWLPFGIGWVYGGNHSIMAGIIKGEGYITTDRAYDVSAFFSYVRFNGNNFIRTSDNAILQKATEFEFASIFEIGRLMHELNLSA